MRSEEFTKLCFFKYNVVVVRSCSLRYICHAVTNEFDSVVTGFNQ